MKRRRLDSDDDSDEYLEAVHAPLSRYAATDGDRDVMREMGIESSSTSSEDSSRAGPVAAETSRTARVVEPSAEGPPQSSRGKKVAGPSVLLSSQTRSDQDVPDELNGLLSDALLAVYQVPLVYLQSNRPVDDRLLAQYQPFSAVSATSRGVPYSQAVPGSAADDVGEDMDGVDETDATGSGHTRRAVYKHPFGLSPGWRWDGVVRGRRHQ